jgi:hypothetical protein
MNARGHNENAMRLGILADNAAQALRRVAIGEQEAIEGWLDYGRALNEGRSIFPSDKEFSAWMLEWQLAIQVEPHERAAAMWAAANADQFAEARAAGGARTVRGIYAKWKEIEAEREHALRAAEMKARAEEEMRLKEVAAEEARLEADAKRAAEEEARRIAAEAVDEEERRAAEAMAEKAATAAAEAEAKAQEASIAVAAIVAEELDPNAKLRAEFRRLTPQAQEDDWVGLRLQVDEQKKRILKQTGDIADLKMRLNQALDTDRGAALGRAMTERDTAKGRMNELMRQIKSMEYRLKKAEGERDAARAALAAQEIQL